MMMIKLLPVEDNPSPIAWQKTHLCINSSVLCNGGFPLSSFTTASTPPSLFSSAWPEGLP